MTRRKWLPYVAFFSLSLCVVPLFAQATTPRRVPVALIAKSGSGEVLAVRYNDYATATLIDFFDSRTSHLVSTADLAPIGALAIDLSPDGEFLLWANSNGDLGLYDVIGVNNTILEAGGAVEIGAIDWSPVDNMIGWAVGRSVQFGDVITKERSGTIISDTALVSSFAWSPDGQRIATSTYGGRDATVELWDNLFGSSEPITVPSLTINNAGGGTITWSPNGERLAVVETGGFLIYDLTTNTSLHVDSEASAVLEWSPDGSEIATGGAAIRVWNPNTGQLVREIAVDSGVVAIQWHPNGHDIYNDGGAEGLYLNTIPVADIALTPTPILTPIPTKTATDTP